MKNAFLSVVVLSLLAPLTALAGEADVLKVEARHEGANRFRFEATVRHNDQGWNHYADRWEVLGPDGNVLGTRVLAHPHVGEQPFTRSLDGVEIPAAIKKVTVRAHDTVHGYGGRSVGVELAR